MPLIANSALPAFKKLQREGMTVLSSDRAADQTIRELHIGILNMMPDSALEATERQFLRLVGNSNPVAQLNVHLFSLSELERGDKACQHIDDYYEDFADIKTAGLDGLIITGANVSQPDLSQEPFWQPLTDVIDWAEQHVTSILCSCLATHAVLQFKYDQLRQPLPEKCWGVYSHRVMNKSHPLVSNTDTRFNVPHSRYNDVPSSSFEDAGLKVLVESPDVGVHMAVSDDYYKLVFLQGHQEYDTISLTKEYKREILNFYHQQRDDYPVFPENIFDSRSRAILGEYQGRVRQAKESGKEMPEFPESLISERLFNTWRDTASAVMSNWVGMVYQLTNADRKLPLMDGLDPQNPLGL